MHDRFPWRLTSLVLLMVLGVILGQSIARRGFSHVGDDAKQAAAPREPVERAKLPTGEQQMVDLFKTLSPSVVYINTRREVADIFNNNVTEVPAGTGSGFFWDDQGHVVTNYHVIAGASGAEIILNDQTSYKAELVGVAPTHDLAVLKIQSPTEKLRPLPLGTSNDVQVGQNVLAIGNPFGLDQTLTTGIVSAKGRTIVSPAGIPIEDVLQTDAAINPGNSGGPLLDSAGRLIGVNTAIASSSKSSAGIGFAVPVDTVNRIVPQLISKGKITNAVLGIQLLPDIYNQRITQQLNLDGIIVYDVPAGGPAADAKLVPCEHDERGWPTKIGDVITRIEGRKVNSRASLIGVLQLYDVGQDVNVTIIRDGKEQTVPVKLGAAG